MSPSKDHKHQILFIIKYTPKPFIIRYSKKMKKNSKKHLQFIKSDGIVLLVAEENTTQRTRYAGVVQW